MIEYQLVKSVSSYGLMQTGQLSHSLSHHFRFYRSCVKIPKEGVMYTIMYNYEFKSIIDDFQIPLITSCY